MTTKAEKAWAAGFFDGEGYVGLPRCTGRYLQLRASIAQVSRLPLDAFVKITGEGRVRGPYTKKNPTNSQPYFSWMAHSDAVRRLFAMIGPFLQLKRAQFEATFLAYEEYQKKNPLGRGRRLSRGVVRLIRRDRHSQAKAAVAFNVSQATVSRIRSRTTYASVGG